MNFEYDEDVYEEDFNARRPRPDRMSSQFATDGSRLYTDPRFYEIGGDGIHRARSHGHGPRPTINIFNDVHQANRPDRGRQPMRPDPYYVPPPAAIPVPYPANVSLNVPGGFVSRSKSRSRSRSNDETRAMYESKIYELRAREKQREEEEAKAKAVQDYLEHQRHEKEEIEAAIRKREAEDDKRKQDEKDMIARWKLREEERKKKEKEEREEAVRKWEQEKKDEDEKQKKQWEAYELKRKADEEKKKEKKKKEDEEYFERMRKDLSKFGLAGNQIDAIIKADEEKEKKKKSSSAALVLAEDLSKRPTYPKIRLADIEVETLKYYGLTWEVDRRDPKYIVILEELSEHETDILFEHTRRIRSRQTLSIESSGKGEKNYAFVRRRSKSRGKSPSRREKFAEAVVFGTRK